MKTVRLVVTMNVPDNVGVRELNAYVRDAIENYGATIFDPDHPLYDRQNKHVRVKRQPQ